MCVEACLRFVQTLLSTIGAKCQFCQNRDNKPASGLAVQDLVASSLALKQWDGSSAQVKLPFQRVDGSGMGHSDTNDRWRQQQSDILLAQSQCDSGSCLEFRGSIASAAWSQHILMQLAMVDRTSQKTVSCIALVYSRTNGTLVKMIENWTPNAGDPISTLKSL